MIEAPAISDASGRGTPVKEIDTRAGASSIAEISQSLEPIILRDFVAAWPAVAAAKSSAQALVSYLLKFDCGAVTPVSVGPPSVDGRIFYNEDFSGMNIDRGNARLSEILPRVLKHGQQNPPPVIYLASAEINDCLPGFSSENPLDFGDADPIASIWIGTRTRIAAHNDLPLNIACVVAGERRFTLFPPDQTPNLYVGPFELTPAGRPISLVDFSKPDLVRFPKFADAMAAAKVAELSAGDALFLPSMWWHHVEATSAFNVLVNYWWRTTPSFLGTPQDVLTHAMMTIRDLPADQKEAWRDIFEHYVFGYNPEEHKHIPENARGILSPMNADNARRVRATLLNQLNR